MSSSSRRAKMEVSLRLYSLPRRELQALCKQYGIPTNKSNVAMADALSACVPVDYAKPKAWAGANSLRVSKTTPLKLKSEYTTGLPETPLVSFTSNGKRKVSPAKLSEKPTVADKEEVSSHKSITTPLQRVVKRFERPPIQMQHEEKTKSTAVPSFTRALHDRIGKAAAAASSHKSQGPTPRKRLGKVVESLTRRGGGALPPGSFSGLLSTPRISEPQLTKPVSKQHVEPETESVEVSYTEIEFRNVALHKELFGVRRNVTVQDNEAGVPSVAREAEFREDFFSESSVEVGFEFRDMAVHKELFGAHPKTNLPNSQGSVQSPPHDLQEPGVSVNYASDLVSSEPFNSPITSSTEILDYSGHNIRVLSSIREEDTSGDSGRKVDKLEEHTRMHHQLLQGRDLGPLLNDMSCGSPPACSLSRMQGETNFALEQAGSTVVSPNRYTPSTTTIHNSPLVNAATPLSKIRNNIDFTLTKATSILEKLAALRADAEKKRREGYWEPKFSAVAENVSPDAVFKTALVVDRDLPSAKKARVAPKAILSLEKGLRVCEDAALASKGEIPTTKRIRISDNFVNLMSAVSDKENQSEMVKEDQISIAGKLGRFGKDKGKKIEALKDRSMNTLDRVKNETSESRNIKSGIGEVRPEEISLRKLRAQFKERIRQFETS